MIRTLLLLVTFTVTLFSYAQVSPVALGRTSHVFTILNPNQNQVYTDDNSGTVAFIHRQDVTIWGGGAVENGKLRYDLSTDGGQTFDTDIGVLNFVYVLRARYPQITGFGTDPDPLNNQLVWSAPTLDNATNWDGIVTGLSDVVTMSPTASTENYDLAGEGTLHPGGLCEGLPGEFWMADYGVDANIAPNDSIYFYKGIYNGGSNDVNWSKYLAVKPNHYEALAGGPVLSRANIAFSPDGQHGWFACLGDLAGGSDSTRNPVLIHSSDGGMSWGSPIEVNLNAASYVGGSGPLEDALQRLWTMEFPIGSGNFVPSSTGRATCAHEFDLTVDANGNPHFFVVIGSAAKVDEPAPGYNIQSDLEKIAVDISSIDNGATWTITRISPVYTHYGEFGTPDGNGQLSPMYNYPQVSRTEDGSRIFYSWADSDTTVIGFGEEENLAPNLRIASLRVSDGFQTCPKWVTRGDAIWDGLALYPTMSPTVLSGTNFKLPIVMLDMLSNDQWAPCQLWYFGNDATIQESEYLAHGNDIDMHQPNCAGVGIAGKPDRINLQLYPNPSSGEVVLQFGDENMRHVEVFDLSGKLVYQKAIMHQSKQVTINLSLLEQGTYSIRTTTTQGRYGVARFVKI